MIDLQATKVDLPLIQTDLIADQVNPIADHTIDQVANPTVDLTAVPIVNPIADLTAVPTADSLITKSTAVAINNMDTTDIYFRKNEIVNGYSILKILGEGRYGIAYLGVNNNSEKCVIKQLKKEMLEETKEKLFYEEQILQSLNYPYFPKFISKFKDEFREGYLLEYIEGSVFEDLIFKEKHKFSKSDIYAIGIKLIELIEILHNHNIIHQDIRLPNVILRGDHELTFIDFGLARFIDNKRYTKDIDYWFFGDFLIHLYYTTYIDLELPERPWYIELNLKKDEQRFLKKLMGIEENYRSITQIKKDFYKIISKN